MKIFLSYCQRNQEQADSLYDDLTKEHKLTITRDIVDLPTFGSLSRFMESVREHDYVIHLISDEYLKSKACMKELLHFMKDDTQKAHYVNRTLPIICKPSSSSHPSIFKDDGQLAVIAYWLEQLQELESKIDRVETTHPYQKKATQNQRKELFIIRDIAENIGDYLSLLSNHINVARLESLKENNYIELLEKVQVNTTEGLEIKPSDHWQILDEAIVVPTYQHPNNPEFPPFSPKFPATPIQEIHIDKRTILIKDESYNPTGSHKDRMAWEIIKHYKKLIRDRRRSASISQELPAASIISAGSAALAIQSMLRQFSLPSLHVLYDKKRTDSRVISRLQSIGCSLYPHDLSEKELTSEDVLTLTENSRGFDVTARALLDPSKRKYYDWLSYEILNQSCTHIFVPVGTGDLFVNLLTILRDELLQIINDERLQVGANDISGINVYGATSDDPKTRMDKIYASYRPTLLEANKLVENCKIQQVCGSASGIYNIGEKYVSEAMNIARQYSLATEPSGMAGLALFLSKQKEIPTDSRILIVNTGWMYLPTKAY
jgi:hypothetical protein